MSWMLWLAVGVVAYWLTRPVRLQAGQPPAAERPYEPEVGGQVGACVLFLDFDGVLHPGNAGTFCRMALFVDFLDARPGWQVVVSSDWRLSHDLEQLRMLFPERVRNRIVGTTPHFPEQPRMREIEAFLAQHAVVQFVVLDDNAALFPDPVPELLLVPNETGLQARQFQILLAST